MLSLLIPCLDMFVHHTHSDVGRWVHGFNLCPDMFKLRPGMRKLLPNLPWSFLIVFHLDSDIKRPFGETTHLDTKPRYTNGLILLTGDNRVLEFDRER